MKLRLPRETDRYAGVESVHRRLLRPLHVQTGSLAGIEFLRQLTLRLVRRIEEISIEPLESAIDLLLRHNLFDAIDRRSVAFRRQTCPFFSMIFLEIVKSVIQGVDQVRGCPRRHAIPDRTVVQNNDTAPRAGQSVRDGKTGDARADDADVRGIIGRKRLQRLSLCRRLPQRDVRPRPAGNPTGTHYLTYEIRATSSCTKSPIRTRSCFIESRSRNVTVSRDSSPFSPRVSKSIVTPNGVPISSCRR